MMKKMKMMKMAGNEDEADDKQQQTCGDKGAAKAADATMHVMTAEEYERYVKANPPAKDSHGSSSSSHGNSCSGYDVKRKTVKTSKGEETIVYWTAATASEKGSGSSSSPQSQEPASSGSSSSGTPTTSSAPTHSASLSSSSSSSSAGAASTTTATTTTTTSTTTPAEPSTPAKQTGLSQPSTPASSIGPRSVRRRGGGLLSRPASSMLRKRPKMETEELRKLKKQRDALKEKLRKLELVRTYRSKHDTADLDELIPKWRGVCQQALQDLADSKPDVTVKQLITHFNIPPKLLKFDMEDEEFID
ncbi:hypothetical protein PTSG_02361 [Salpingoeca rosetta]|uniref:Swi5-dependent recombination DNA repair protein 1 homolog n=1 Tax=Salpingoeca rosetta (strain ATCC 50818 / BSB-021) TaxID=946362 RepID=F2U1Z3_SALR5|nr:uncharacterized protein PTSG_02361 [Salpingoeca rosetta]EGD81645.1 hypothetical protein PTSG_02361 [Salpingoeca rosetta]|eukprot:XP_004996849.1 hypothetical protein PTSG_02361 [Salpingoeca rosetta]